MLFNGGSSRNFAGAKECGHTTFMVSNDREPTTDFKEWIYSVTKEDGGEHVTFRGFRCGLHPKSTELFQERWARGADLEPLWKHLDQHGAEVDVIFGSSDANITHILYIRRGSIRR